MWKSFFYRQFQWLKLKSSKGWYFSWKSKENPPFRAWKSFLSHLFRKKWYFEIISWSMSFKDRSLKWRDRSLARKSRFQISEISKILLQKWRDQSLIKNIPKRFFLFPRIDPFFLVALRLIIDIEWSIILIFNQNFCLIHCWGSILLRTMIDPS